MSQKIHFLVNPNSGGGSVRRNWESISERIQKRIGNFNFTFTSAKGEGSSLATELVNSGTQVLVIIGGDGTVSEVVDGVMRSKKPDSVSLVVLNLGTGGDFSKTLGVPGDLDMALQKIDHGKQKLVDVGKLLYKKDSGSDYIERYFINITGCGMAGAVVRSVNQSAKRFGGFSYYLSSLGNVLSYTNKPLRFRLDGGEWITRKVTTLAICNGQYFGGGMRVSPNSEIADGVFDITILNDWNLFQKAVYSKNLYNGTILQTSHVESYHCKKIEIEPIDTKDLAIIDCDGEDIGFIPMTVEVIPSAVRFLI